MTPEAKLRMEVYQEGQRAYAKGAECPYPVTDWKRKTWLKGFLASKYYYASMEAQVGAPASTHQERDSLPSGEPGEWAECQRICDLPEVDEMFAGFTEDATNDAAVMIVRAVRAEALRAQAADVEAAVGLSAGGFLYFITRQPDGSDWPAGTKFYAHPPQAPQAVGDDDIRRIFLANGFTVKEGQTDLKPYVFQAARALLALATKGQQS